MQRLNAEQQQFCEGHLKTTFSFASTLYKRMKMQKITAYEDAQQLACQMLAQCCLKYRHEYNVKFETYLFKCISRAYIDLIRATLCPKRRQSCLEIKHTSIYDRFEGFERIDNLDEIEAAGQCLTKRERRILEDRYLNGLEARDVAKKLRCTRESIYIWSKEAKDKILASSLAQ